MKKKNVKTVLLILVVVLVLWPLIRKLLALGLIAAIAVAIYLVFIRGKKS